jgi:hypothetical protein
VKTLDELKAPITAATVNVTNDTLQRVWHKTEYGWDVRESRAIYDAHCEVYRTLHRFHLCAK